MKYHIIPLEFVDPFLFTYLQIGKNVLIHLPVSYIPSACFLLVGLLIVLIFNCSFPRNPDIKEKWILATGRQNWIPGKVATICSNHFDPDHFVAKTGERRYLNSLAVPSRNVDSSHDVQLTTVNNYAIYLCDQVISKV